MTKRIDRSIFVKIPGIKPNELAALHQMVESKQRGLHGAPIVKSSTFNLEKGTYTVELECPTNGTVGDEYQVPKWCTHGNDLLDVLQSVGIFPTDFSKESVNKT